MTKIPLVPPVWSTNWLNQTGPGRSVGPPAHFLSSLSLSLTQPNPNSWAISCRWRRRHGRHHSPVDFDSPRAHHWSHSTQRAIALLAICVDLDPPSSTGHAQALPWQALMSSSTNSIDLCSLGTLVLLAASSNCGAWLAPAWPRFGTAVAGQCHHAAMDAAMDTLSYHCISFYPSLYSISYICLSSGYWFILC
jgi:hypothetical protein